jgi:hypothetical protein
MMGNGQMSLVPGIADDGLNEEETAYVHVCGVAHVHTMVDRFMTNGNFQEK